MSINSSAVHVLPPYAKRILFALLPSFIQHYIQPSIRRPAKLFSTSWLDGLRGLAAYFVYNYHLHTMYLGMFLPLYGLPVSKDGSPARSSIMQLPYIRVVYSGRPMVHIFFIVSGYALSLKPLKQLRSKQYNALLNTISSSVFRRAMRLSLPVLFSTTIGCITLQMGIRRDYNFSLHDNFWYWYTENKQALEFWNANSRQKIKIDPQLWTIPLEMANSMVLFLSVLGLARCTVPIRMCTVVGLIIWCILVGQWVASEFLMGMFLAELSLIQDELREYLYPGGERAVPLERTRQVGSLLLDKNESLEELKETFKGDMQLWKAWETGTKALQIVCPISVLCSLYVCGWPEKGPEQSKFFTWLTDHTMQTYHSGPADEKTSLPWFALTALVIVFACQQMRYMQLFLETPVVQYLGKISYSMYLIHWTIIGTVGPRVIKPLWHWIDVNGPWAATAVWFLAQLTVTPVLIWSSDLFVRAVDERCIKFVKQLEERCLLVE